MKDEPIHESKNTTLLLLILMFYGSTKKSGALFFRHSTRYHNDIAMPHTLMGFI